MDTSARPLSRLEWTSTLAGLGLVIGVAVLLDDLRQRRRLLLQRASAQHVLGEKPTGQRRRFSLAPSCKAT